MTAAEVATISVVVTAIVQVLKKALPGSGYGIYLAAIVSLVAVAAWVASGVTWPPARTDLWAFFSGWASVFATAAGVYSISTTQTNGAGRAHTKTEDVPPLPDTAPRSRPRPALED